MSKKVRLYTDGGSRGNPGPAASGAVIFSLNDGEEGQELATATHYLGTATNNQAEYTAVIIGLKKAKELAAKEVDVVMDSELAVRQLNGIYKVKNEDLAKRFMEIWHLRQDFDQVTFRHVARAKNKRADALVNKCLDEQGC